MPTPVPTPARNILQTPEDDEFKYSYEHYEEYPENLVYQTTYPGAAEEDITRLNDSEDCLFEKTRFKVPFRDYVGHGKQPSPILPRSCSNESLQDKMVDLINGTCIKMKS